MNRSIRLILKTCILVLIIFSIFRIILFVTEFDRVFVGNTTIETVLKAFLMGVRFDIVICGYILIVPTLVLLIFELINKSSKLIYKIVFYWVFLFFTIAFLISGSDIPFFNHFYDRFNIGAFVWFDNLDFVFSMIIQEPKYFLIIVPFIILEIVFYKVLRSIFIKTNKENPVKLNIFINIALSLLFLGFLFLGIRGRIEKKSPIRVGTAYFSDNACLNKLGLNPVFTLVRSYLDAQKSCNQQLQLIDKKMAIQNVRKYLNIKDTTFSSCIARQITFDSIIDKKPNIIIVIMESMSAEWMERHGNKHNITPFLDSLSLQSLYFENIYTAGKHTYNGIFSTLFSFPALYRQHSMKKIRNYDGISNTLIQNGYSTTYFTTHDSQFDNVEGFLRANKFQNVVSQNDYPDNEVKTVLGVPDDYMFRYAIPYINNLSKAEKPFFVAFMTASNHGPYYLPEYFTPKSNVIDDQIIEYADWSLKRFIELSSKEEWFENTIFVFVADHGAPVSSTYDISLSYFHTPLIFYSPQLISSLKVISKIGCQIDIYPTIMGLIKQPYVNNTLGIDLLNESREFAIVNDDDKIGVLDTIDFCIIKKGRQPELFNYRTKSKNNYFEQNKLKANRMIEYAKSFMQVHQEMILTRETTLCNNL